ncbi:MAG: hypothetical protein ACREYE_05075, partial [Gammaproteobacteria bacterium]
AFPTACPQVGGCPQAPQATTIGYSISNSKPIVQTHTSIGIDCERGDSVRFRGQRVPRDPHFVD